jgi:hypothetical protein
MCVSPPAGNAARAALTERRADGEWGMIRSRFLLFLMLACCGAPVAVAAPAQKAEQLIEVIAPSKSEAAWLSIPWETDLAAARRKAAAESKPIFLWEMDGHPLGCT